MLNNKNMLSKDNVQYIYTYPKTSYLGLMFQDLLKNSKNGSSDWLYF